MKIVAVSLEFWYILVDMFPWGMQKRGNLSIVSCLRAKRKIQEAHFIIWHSLLALCHHLFVNLWLPLLFFCLAIFVSISCLIHQWIFVDLSTFSLFSLLTFALFSLCVFIFLVCVHRFFRGGNFSILLPPHTLSFASKSTFWFNFLAKQNFLFCSTLPPPLPAATLCLLIYILQNYINIHAYTSIKTLYPALYNVYVLAAFLVCKLWMKIKTKIKLTWCFTLNVCALKFYLLSTFTWTCFY